MSTANSVQLGFVGNVVHELRIPALVFLLGYIFILVLQDYMHPAAALVDAPVKSVRPKTKRRRAKAKAKKSTFAQQVATASKVAKPPSKVGVSGDKANSKGAEALPKPLLSASEAASLHPDIPGMSDSMSPEDIAKLFHAKLGEDNAPLDIFRAEMNRRLGTLHPPMTLTKITADGHCLYRSVAHFLEHRRGIIRTVKQLRQEAHDYLVERSEEFSARYIPEDHGMSFEVYCAGIIDPSRAQYGGDLELMTLVERYQFVAHVYQLTGNEDALQLTMIPFRPVDDSIDVSQLPIYRLAFAGRSQHYDAVEPWRSLGAKSTAGILPRIPESVYSCGLLLAMVLFLRYVYFSRPAPKSAAVPAAKDNLTEAPLKPPQQQ